MYVTLERAKSFLNVYYSEKDAEIELMIDAAERHVAEFLNRPLTDPELTTEGDSPPPDSPGAIELLPNIQMGILYYVADFWANREINVIGASVAKNDMAERILYPYRIDLGV